MHKVIILTLLLCIYLYYSVELFLEYTGMFIKIRTKKWMPILLEPPVWGWKVDMYNLEPCPLGFFSIYILGSSAQSEPEFMANQSKDSKKNILNPCKYLCWPMIEPHISVNNAKILPIDRAIRNIIL